MKSEKAKEILNDGACHVSDGELLDGHRVGCTDLVYYNDAIEAIKAAEQKAEERMRQKAIEAFDDMWFSGMEPNYEYHLNNFIQKLTEQ